jgi:hypothetical protein
MQGIGILNTKLGAERTKTKGPKPKTVVTYSSNPQP